VLRWFRRHRIELVCPVCGDGHTVPERWLAGAEPLRCDCGRYIFYPEAERLRRQQDEGR
jgi:hypothetical protein